MELEESTCLTSGSTTKPQSSESILLKYSNNFPWNRNVCSVNFRKKLDTVFEVALCIRLLGDSYGKKSTYNAGNLGLIPGSERSPGEGNDNIIHIFAWRIPWTEEAGELQSMGSKRVRQTEQLILSLFTFTYA